ncbi:MAG: GNAT family N-acetyltransferase [Chloroflexi bacterium]|nr:MAG: GNAT family N-acetyltransferase [Chloroflexota bacterium]
MNQPEVTIVPFTMSHYEAAIALWRESEGIGLSHADEPEGIAAYLARNPGLSLTAWAGEQLVGAVLCGHDGRRGFIHHLAIHPQFRQQGIGRALVARCLENLRGQGIDKCHLFVFHQNESAIAFWQALGWELRKDILVMSHYTNEHHVYTPKGD